jgi:glycosidase
MRNPSTTSQRRVCIYQLFLRLFGNTNETRKSNGTLAENGVGKFADLNSAALGSLKEMGFTHVWLTGVFQQATSTDYPEIGALADDPDLLKGLAGSPYAIKDYFDVCPDYAERPAERLAEFRALIARMHDAELGVILDFVPNHVARSYHSDVRPDLDFGALDDRAKFFDPKNNFFYLQADSPGGGPPLRLPTVSAGQLISPTCKVLGWGDGLFTGELDHGKVTGNNVVSWRPALTDWYETIKLNYGYDFTTGLHAYPDSKQPDLPVPDTWLKMDAVLAYWQEMGIDGFRCDMAHLVPLEFWKWAVTRARMRQPSVYFVAEAYDNDPMKVFPGNALEGLLYAGFDAVYDDPSYKILKGIYDGPKWANDLDDLPRSDLLFHRSLRYAENHDEVRLAAANQWGGIGMEVGRPVSAILFGLGRGPALVLNGQEVGEPARGEAGFSTDNVRTTIFDYWSMPELVKWVNDHRYDGGRLSQAQKNLRAFYSRLIRLVEEPAFRDGDFYPLNPSNRWNARYGQIPGETVSGHWLYAFLRFDPATSQRFVIVVNLNPRVSFPDVQIYIRKDAIDFLKLAPQQVPRLVERLQSTETTISVEASTTDNHLILSIASLPPLTPAFFEMHLS